MNTAPAQFRSTQCNTKTTNTCTCSSGVLPSTLYFTTRSFEVSSTQIPLRIQHCFLVRHANKNDMIKDGQRIKRAITSSKDCRGSLLASRNRNLLGGLLRRCLWERHRQHPIFETSFDIIALQNEGSVSQRSSERKPKLTLMPLGKGRDLSKRPKRRSHTT